LTRVHALEKAADDEPLLRQLRNALSNDLCWGRTLYVDDPIAWKDTRGKRLGAQLLSHVQDLARVDGDHSRLCSRRARFDPHRFYEVQSLTRPSFQFAAAT